MSDPADYKSDQSQRAITTDWIKAIVASAQVGFVMGGIAYLMRQAFGLTGSNTGIFGILLLFATEIVTAIPSFAVYANRTATVLRRKLPGFPTLTWYGLHVLLGIAVGTIVAFLTLDPDPPSSRSPELDTVIAVAIGGVVVGAVLCGALGALQALVLRKVTHTVGSWIGWSTIGGMALALFVVALYIPDDDSIASEVLTLCLGFVVAVLAGSAMLPAVHRLKPR